MYKLRTRASPGLGSGTSTVAKEKLSRVGSPWGGLARGISRLVVGMVVRCGRRTSRSMNPWALLDAPSSVKTVRQSHALNTCHNEPPAAGEGSAFRVPMMRMEALLRVRAVLIEAL